MGKPPSEWTVRKFADVGAQEPFLARLAIGLPEILDGTLYENRDAIKEAILDLTMHCLMPAFLSLRELRNIADKNEVPVLTKTKHFDDMCKSLWAVYKDRMANVAKLMGYDIGFLFRKDSKFKRGCDDFLKANPGVSPELIARMNVNRDTWQPDLVRFRNDYLEHKTMNHEDVASFYSLACAEALFDRVWVSVEELLVILMAAKLPAGFAVRELTDEERVPDLPKRFGWRMINPT
jgi:hypothetical protein